MHLPEDRLDEMESRFKEIEGALADPEVASRPDEIRSLGKEHAELKPVVEAWLTYRQARADLEEAKTMLSGTSSDERAYLEVDIRTKDVTIELLED